MRYRGSLTLPNAALAFFSALLSLSVPEQATALSAHIQPQQSVKAPAGFSGVCQRYAWACARGGQATAPAEAILNLADRVNRRINAEVAEVSDKAQYGREEYWSLPTAAGGDCEDFALAKKRALIAHGVAPEHLLIATVLDENRDPHAVLVLRMPEADVVLDNRASRIKPWRNTGYTFLRIQDARQPARWRAVLAGGFLGAPGN